MSQAKDIIDDIKHRFPDRAGNIYPALNRAIRLVSKRLKYHGSSSVKGALSVSITAGASSGTLPTDFWGLLGEPYISGETYALKPLPDLRTKLIYSTASTPIYYEIYGSTINLIPGSSGAATVLGDYWQRPTKITKPTDTIPYLELWDDVIQEALIHIYSTGGSSVDANYISMMENFIYKSIDEVIPGLERKAPTRIEDANQYNSLMWD